MGRVFEVGDLVQSEARPEWGIGQVQSRIGERLTVNFENEGKVVLLGAEAELRLVTADWT